MESQTFTAEVEQQTMTSESLGQTALGKTVEAPDNLTTTVYVATSPHQPIMVTVPRGLGDAYNA